VNYSFEIIDHPNKAGLHRYTVRIDKGKPWLKNDPLLTTDEKLRLFRELLAWMQLDGAMEISLKEV